MLFFHRRLRDTERAPIISPMKDKKNTVYIPLKTRSTLCQPIAYTLLVVVWRGV